MTDKRGTK